MQGEHTGERIIPVKDSGYTAACPRCCKRFNERADMVGVERVIDVIFCSDACQNAFDNYFKKGVQHGRVRESKIRRRKNLVLVRTS